MAITLIHEEGLKFIAQEEKNFTVDIDASPLVGGKGLGFRPMELLLVSLASCTSIDTVLILNKSRKPYHNYRVTVDGKRREETPQSFAEITMTFSLESGKITVDQFQRAVSLSLNKYCSVAETLRTDLPIYAQIIINGEKDPRVIVKNAQ